MSLVFSVPSQGHCHSLGDVQNNALQLWERGTRDGPAYFPSTRGSILKFKGCSAVSRFPLMLLAPGKGSLVSWQHPTLQGATEIKAGNLLCEFYLLELHHHHNFRFKLQLIQILLILVITVIPPLQFWLFRDRCTQPHAVCEPENRAIPPLQEQARLRSAEGSNVSATRENPQLAARPKPERAAAARPRTSNAKPKNEQSNTSHV